MRPPTSARGLFRATGKKAKPVAVRDLLGDIVKADRLEREENEFYPTPPEPIRALLSAELPRLRSFPRIWSPACGSGALSIEMRAVGLNVYESDLIDRGCGAEIRSFYDYASAPAPAVVENPPFDECNKDDGWIRHALERLGVEYMALLLPVNWIGSGSKRATLWEEHPPARLYVMRWRIDFTGQGAPPMLNMWAVWERGHKGPPVLLMLDRDDDARQSSLFSDAEGLSSEGVRDA